MKNVIIVILLLVVVVVAAALFANRSGVVNYQQNKKEAVSVKHSIDQVETVCQFLEKYALVIRNSQSLEEAKPLNDGDRANLAEWFTNADFRNMSGAKRIDCEKCKGAVLAFLTNPPKDGLSRGHDLAELSQNMELVLVDFELSGPIAEKNGHPALSKNIDAHLDLAKAFLLVNHKIKPIKPEVRPIVKLFSEYFVIYTDLFGAAVSNQNRPALAQTALLSMRPEKLTDPHERELFKEMHESMLRISNMITEKENASKEAGRLSATITSLMKDLKITPEELEDATSKNLADAARAMLKLSD